jgi:hypothetical protein
MLKRMQIIGGQKDFLLQEETLQGVNKDLSVRRMHVIGGKNVCSWNKLYRNSIKTCVTRVHVIWRPK